MIRDDSRHPTSVPAILTRSERPIDRLGSRIAPICWNVAAGISWHDGLFPTSGLAGRGGNRLTGRTAPSGFRKNSPALESLGVSDREYDVLKLLAEGHSNQEIADLLFVSANTVKTRLAHLYEKLEVSRRTQAIQKAKALSLIP